MSRPLTELITSGDNPAKAPAAQLVSVLARTEPGELWLLIAPFRLLPIERQLIPLLALRGSVHIIVGGHQYDVDGILRGIRKLTPDVRTVQERIRQRRSPTAFQMRALLRNTPSTTDPVIVLNFLINYFDDDEHLWKSRYLLEDSIAELVRLSQNAPVVVTARPPQAKHKPYAQLFALLREMTDRVVEFRPQPSPRQTTLW